MGYNIVRVEVPALSICLDCISEHQEVILREIDPTTAEPCEIPPATCIWDEHGYLPIVLIEPGAGQDIYVSVIKGA